jgi:hypothetical protein
LPILRGPKENIKGATKTHILNVLNKTASNAFEHGRIDILEYLLKIGFDFVLYDDRTMNNYDALIKDNVEQKLYPLRHNDDINVLAWLVDKDFAPYIKYTSSTIDGLSFLHDKGLINTREVELNAILSGSLEALEWLKSNGYEITKNGLRYSLKDHHLDIAEWYLDQGIRIREAGYFDLLIPKEDTGGIKGSLELLDWLKDRNIISKDLNIKLLKYIRT